MPKILPGTCIECAEVAIGIAGENYAARSRQAPSVGRRKVFELPFLLARERVKRPQRSPGFFTAGGNVHAAQEIMTLVIFLRRVGEYIALLRRGHIQQPR